MDHNLKDKLDKWWKHIDELEHIELTYRELEASNETMLGVLVAADKSSAGITEKRSKALAHPDFVALQEGLARAKTAYHKGERRLELYKAAYGAEYLSCKHEFEAINKKKIGD